MSLRRVDCFFEELNTPEDQRGRILDMAREYSAKSQGMMDKEDLKALGAALLHSSPRRIFEIGTFRGNTTDFCLTLLPALRVVSIAFLAPTIRFLSKDYNNSHRSKEEIGCEVQSSNVERYTQLYGDSHKLKPEQLLNDFGPFDLVIVDGDHTAKGVALDTILAAEILEKKGGGIIWHDANPKEKYRDVREYLEKDLSVNAIATRDNYVGGVAYWRGLPESLAASNPV